MESENNNVFPLTNVQTAYVMGRNSIFELGGRSTHIYYEFVNELDINKFNIAFNKFIKVQPMLRAVIEPTGYQKILDKVPEYHIEQFDLTNSSKVEKQKFILKKREEMSHHIFKIDKWPLFNIEMAQIESNKVYMFCDFDLLIADATSLIILIDEVMNYYDTDAEPVPLEASFRDYVYKLLDVKNSRRYQVDKNFWKKRLMQYPPAPNLISGFNKKMSLPKFKRLQTVISSDIWSKIKRIAEEKMISPTIVLCTAYSMILGYWSNQKSFTINCPVSGKSKADKKMSRVMGDFTKELLLPINRSNIETGNFWENATAVRDVFMMAYKHSAFDGMDIIKQLEKKYRSGTDAIMPIVFTSMVFQDEKFNLLDKLGQLKYGISQTPQVYLDCQVMEIDGELTITWDYVEDLFDKQTITGMFNKYEALVLNINIDGFFDKNIFNLSYEDRLLIKEYNNTNSYIEKATLQDILFESFEKYSDEIAISDGKSSIKYKELNKLTDEVAATLKAEGLGVGDFIGIDASRCTETVINILGVIKCGAAYVPINSEYPEERQRYIYKRSGCKKMLYASYIHNVLKHSSQKLILNKKANSSDTAYVIYTSGSTGEPKGVVISNKSVCNTILDINSRFNVTKNDKVIGISSFCFDLSVYDIFGTIAAGAQLYIASSARNIPELIDIVRKEKITVWNTVPAIMELYIDELQRIEQKQIEGKCAIDNLCNNKTLRVVMLSGDWIPISLPNRIKSEYPDANIYSLGGATEASIWSIYYPVNKTKVEWSSIPYGYPLSNQRLYILDDNMQLCPVGVVGQLYIGGSGVAVCYQNDVEKTKAAFIEHEKLGRIYSTGDYGVMNRNGYIEFKGRKDNQVKIRGHRIELGEIENVLMKHESVENVAVINYKDNKDKNYLCAYIVTSNNIDNIELVNWAASYLPDYMVPRQYVKLSEIPLTSNGKINKKVLPVPEIKSNLSKYVEPRNIIEKKLVEIWQEILGVNQIGIYDDFFDLGGDSISIIKIINKASDNNIQVSLNDMYKYTTINSLSPHVKSSSNIDFDNISKIMNSVNQLAKYTPDEKYESDYANYTKTIQNIKFKKNITYNNILLTGATGFFGSHLAKELLIKTKAQIYLLIRGKDEDSANKRIKSIWKYYFKEVDYIEKYSNRITIVLGDVSKDKLGIPQDKYDYLAETIDCVIHSAGNVNHYGLWEEYKKVNVEGTQRIAKFSQYKRKKYLHYISTISTGFSIDRYNSMKLFNEYNLTYGEKSDIEYCQSKIEGEKIVLDAQKEGVKSKIYRLGFLIQSYEDGIFQINENASTIFGILSMFTKLGMVPDVRAKIFDLTFGDQAAKAIVLLSGINDNNNIYHIFNPNKMSIVDFAKCLNSTNLCNEINIKTIDEFKNYLVTNHKKFKRVISQIVNLGLLEKVFNPAMLCISTCKRTEMILEKLGFKWGKLDSTRSLSMSKVVKRIDNRDKNTDQHKKVLC